MLNGVGGAKINPKIIGTFMGRKEDTLIAQGINSLVSGWIAAFTAVYANLSFFIYSFDFNTVAFPVMAC